MNRQQRLRPRSEARPRLARAAAQRGGSHGVALAARAGGVAALQRAVGNRGVGRLLKTPGPPRAALLQRELIGLEEFKTKSSAFGFRPGLLTAIDAALDAFQSDRATGFRASARLRALKHAIDAWLAQPDADASPRTPAVRELSQAVAAELEGRAAYHRVPRGEKHVATSYAELDGQQFRLASSGGMIETVTRTQGGGYEATGRVVGFEGMMPMIMTYRVPEDLGPWRPEITHLNGMDVAPREGIMSAVALQKAVNGEVTGDPVDVLYTYSASRGFAVDVLSCVGAKAGKGGNVTELQVGLMTSAVESKRRITMSAHSRGTIKTDNAVRLTFKRLVAKKVKRGRKQKAAESDVKAAMDRYIQLIYAGNAVSYPSSVLKIKMFTAGGDLVSMGVGTYTESGARWASGNASSNMVRTAGGHGFDVNYARVVGVEAAHDIDLRP